MEGYSVVTIVKAASVDVETMVCLILVVDATEQFSFVEFFASYFKDISFTFIY